MIELIGYFLALFVGISLGLIGGGGAILAVPILVYLFNIIPELATSYSLCIVGIAALIGTYKHFKLGNLNLDAALKFGLPSIISLLTTRKFILPSIPNSILEINKFIITKNILIMVVFAILMIAASLSMITSKKETNKINASFAKLILIGLLIGFITGFLGAGGGFLIIPALIFFAGLSMKQAVATSLFIIAINSLIGFTGDIINGVTIDFNLLTIFSLIAVIGIFVGTKLSKQIDGNKLKPAFGWFVLVMGIYIIAKELL